MLQFRSHRFIAAFLSFLLAFLLRAKFGILFDWWPDLVLALLIALAFYLPLGELVFFIVLAAFFLNWQPAVSLEIGLIVALPLLVFLFRLIVFRLEGWASNLFALVSGIAIFYLASDPALGIEAYVDLLRSISISVPFGFLIFELFGYFYTREEAW